MQGSGATEVANLATLTMTGVGKSAEHAHAAPLTGSTVNWNAGNPHVNTGGNIDNTGLFHVTFDGNIGNAGTAGGFVNNNGGTLRKSTTTGSLTLTNINLSNNGILDIDLGKVDVTGTFSSGRHRLARRPARRRRPRHPARPARHQLRSVAGRPAQHHLQRPLPAAGQRRLRDHFLAQRHAHRRLRPVQPPRAQQRADVVELLQRHRPPSRRQRRQRRHLHRQDRTRERRGRQSDLLHARREQRRPGQRQQRPGLRHAPRRPHRHHRRRRPDLVLRCRRDWSSPATPSPRSTPAPRRTSPSTPPRRARRDRS